jgi:hypothetical protein
MTGAGAERSKPTFPEATYKELHGGATVAQADVLERGELIDAGQGNYAAAYLRQPAGVGMDAISNCLCPRVDH